MPYEIHVSYFWKKDDAPLYQLHSSIFFHPIAINGNSRSFGKRLMVIPNLYKEIKRIVKEVLSDIIINENMKLVSYILPFTFKHTPRIYVIHFSYEGLIIMDKESFHNPLKQYVMMWLRKNLLKNMIDLWYSLNMIEKDGKPKLLRSFPTLQIL